jgi:ABC-type multidrug transport system ATPase subunit
LINIEIDKLGKRFNREWIFRNLSYSIPAGNKLVVTGANGSGKSTFLLMLSGYVLASEGSIEWRNSEGKLIDKNDYYHHISIASPAMELIEEFSPLELIKHQASFKKFQYNLSANEIIEIAYLENSKYKAIKNFSSGMKQRLKLSLAVLSDCPVLLLDEPIINLDLQGIQWYKQLIEKYASHKTIVVCSNKVKDEYEFCEKEISINYFK